MCYIGSTIDTLSNRMAGHRSKYNVFMNEGKGQHYQCFEIFEKYGLDNCKIELVELYPCNSSIELRAREGHHQKSTDCVNKNYGR